MKKHKDLLKISLVIFIYILCIISYFYVADSNDGGILYSGVKPYIWGKSISVSFFSVAQNFGVILILGCMIAILELLRNLRSKGEKKTYIACVIINVISLLYILFVTMKYNPVIYDVNEPMLNANGTEICIMQVLRVPVILVCFLSVLLIGYIVLDIKAKRKNSEFYDATKVH